VASFCHPKDYGKYNTFAKLSFLSKGHLILMATFFCSRAENTILKISLGKQKSNQNPNWA
jgi:hypothetical protein